MSSKVFLIFLFFLSVAGISVQGQDITTQKRKRTHPAAELPWPPVLPGGQSIVTDESDEFITIPAGVQLAKGVGIAKKPPRIDFMFPQGQRAFTKLWSAWGDGSTEGNNYYTSIGDHNSPKGTAQVYEYDATKKELRLLIDVKDFLETNSLLPDGMDYIPGKIHGLTEKGKDGWIYFSTHRGSTKDNTTDARGYLGDWIFRVNPVTLEKEIVTAYPMSKHTIPASVLDKDRMIFYGGTAAGNDASEKGSWFIAYDIKNKKLLKRADDGFDRYAIFSRRSGRVYWRNEKELSNNLSVSQGYRYDPKTNNIVTSTDVPAVRSSTHESKDGFVYGFSQGSNDLWSFNTTTEKTTVIGPAMVGSQNYVTSVDLDPANERYLYYVPGAHGGSKNDGTPIVQFDLKTNTRKVIAFIHPFYQKKYGYSADGTFSTALNADGSILFVTFNGSRAPGAREWDTVSVMAIHIPKSERMP